MPGRYASQFPLSTFHFLLYSFCFTSVQHLCFLLCTFYICSYIVLSALHFLYLLILYRSHITTFFPQLWVYAYFPTLALELIEELPLAVPYSRRYDGQLQRRTYETFTFFQHYFDMVAAHEVTQNTVNYALTLLRLT